MIDKEMDREKLYSYLEKILWLSECCASMPTYLRDMHEVVSYQVCIVMMLKILKDIGIIVPEELELLPILQTIDPEEERDDYSTTYLMSDEVYMHDERAASSYNRNSEYYQCYYSFREIMDDASRIYLGILSRKKALEAQELNVHTLIKAISENAPVTNWSTSLDYVDIMDIISLYSDKDYREELIEKLCYTYGCQDDEVFDNIVKRFPETCDIDYDREYFKDNGCTLAVRNMVLLESEVGEDAKDMERLAEYYNRIGEVFYEFSIGMINGSSVKKCSDKILVNLSPFMDSEMLCCFDIIDISPLAYVYLIILQELYQLEKQNFI